MIPAPAIQTAINTRTGQDVTTATGRDGASLRRCPKCRAVVLVGLDDHVAAMTATADLDPLDPAGEAQAWLTGRATYRLMDRGPRTQLRRRDHHAIAGHPAGVVTVVAEHRCGHPLGTPTPTSSPEATSDRVPF